MGATPSKPGPPGTKFRVIGAGMSRTGTKTVAEALAILLDGPVHDSGTQSLSGSMRQIKLWLAAMELAPRAKTFADHKRMDAILAELTEGYVATLDCPAITMTPELMRLYPDAIVVCSTRDEASWWRSMEFTQNLMSTYYLPFVVLWLPRVQMFGKWRILLGKLAEWRWGDDMIVPATLRKHEDHLRQVVPAEKLFFYDVRDGWEPLCKILNVPVPDVPFPHNNSKKDAQKVHDDLVFVGLLSWVGVLSLLYSVYWVIFVWWARR